MAVGDLDEDDKLDLLVANTTDETFSLLLGNGDGTFQGVRVYAVGSTPRSVAVSDFNGDGKADLATASGDPFATSSTVSILPGQGNGTFPAAVNFDAGPSSQFVVAGDFNADGKADLAVANGQEHFDDPRAVSILLGRGNGTFQPRRGYSGASNPRSIATGDLNGDGKVDLAVANGSTSQAVSDKVSILLGTGTGAFRPAVHYRAGLDPRSVAIGDFNGDGKADLAVANSAGLTMNPGDVAILLGVGNGTFQPAVNYSAGTKPFSVAVGDFNSDGKADLAVANLLSGVSVLLGNGNGSFQPAVNVWAGTGPFSVAVGDFNLDGKADLAVVRNGPNELVVLVGNGNGAFELVQWVDAGSDSRHVAVGDFNGDRKPDLAVTNRGIAIFLNITSSGQASSAFLQERLISLFRRVR